MLSVRQVVAHHTAYVRPETVPDAVDVVRRSPGMGEVRVKLGGALGHQPGVAQRRQVTREERQRFPVHRKHVVVLPVQVRCNKNATETKKKNKNSKLRLQSLIKLYDINNNHYQIPRGVDPDGDKSNL